MIATQTYLNARPNSQIQVMKTHLFKTKRQISIERAMLYTPGLFIEFQKSSAIP
ncbi:hypothetical protein [Lacticaseibacillus manihotivorans]|jgi:hypothetical protein|uniref:Uncharacterized protein n=1 Tax=Lacticaseibacillus manihotivorans DSM 13343 = JCM 12514 TaxID=1423769 RepID=A0A0R1R3N7_9LACO|nr:hypothetical protein [Lacticaseibacillus manihotivorans]KRL51006.1 hypothetical protein FD01_GL003043 [Lacticaseibacillus manihotivorans DSM 13343 = JCM 12514]